MSMTAKTLVESTGPAVLIVDDDPDIGLVLHDLLRHDGYQVQVTSTGAEALARAKDASFSAVLLDLMLPDMDGLSVLTLLKQIDPLLPVIMLTAFVEVAKKHGSLTEGAFGYLTKPYDGEELKALIKRAVGVKHLSIEAAAAKKALSASEDRFREVVQTAPDAIVLADGAGYILTWNKAAERLFGYNAGEAQGQSLTMIMPERYRVPHQLALQRISTTGELRLKGATVTMHGLHKDGREFPIEMSLSSWISGGQRVHCGIVRDITARKESEARLLQQQLEQQALLDLIPAMVWYKDPHNRILRVNRRAAESLQKPIAEIEGHTTEEFYPDEAERYHQDDLEVIVSGRPKVGIVEPYRAGSGEKRWIQTDKVPYLDPGGHILGVLVFAQDITERRRTEEALRETEERLRILMESALHGLVMVDAGGTILMVNARLETQFGYESGELLRRAVDSLLPPRLRARHSEQRSAFLVHAEESSLSNRRHLIGVRKDGTEFPLTIYLNPRATTEGVYVVASVGDPHGVA